MPRWPILTTSRGTTVPPQPESTLHKRVRTLLSELNAKETDPIRRMAVDMASTALRSCSEERLRLLLTQTRTLLDDVLTDD